MTNSLPEPATSDTFDEVPAEPREPIVELTGVSRHYREGTRTRVVLDGADATLWRGETVVLLGRSGSGKSTLLNLISGIDQPDAGDVRVAGHSLRALDERARTLMRREAIGFVFQFFNLLPTLTVEENLLLPLELNRRDRAAARQRVHELLAEVDLADRADSFPDRLSGGEQQRVAIVRALVHNPPLLLADEPTGNLDADTGAQVLTLMARLAQAHGTTMLMVTHQPDTARTADRVLAIRDHKLVELPQPEAV